MLPNDTFMDDKLIYIVDDDKVILHLLEYTFKSKGGYEIKTFLSGEELLGNIDLKPDLIVLDHIFFNKMNGLEVLKEIRKKFADLPVIVLTGEDSVVLKNEFLQQGADEFINKKDYFIDTLIETVEGIFPN